MYTIAVLNSDNCYENIYPRYNYNPDSEGNIIVFIMVCVCQRNASNIIQWQRMDVRQRWTINKLSTYEKGNFRITRFFSSPRSGGEGEQQCRRGDFE